MKCPNCSNILKRKNFHGALIDICEKCNGVWFDRDELRKAKDNTDDSLRWLDFDLFEEKVGKYHTSSSEKDCPVDSIKILQQKYDKSNVLVETCPKCQGVWLDKNEFEKIIRYLHKEIYSETAKEYSVDLLKQLLEIGTGNESKLSEVKDFLAVLRLFEERLAVEHPWSIQLYQFFYRNLPFK